MAEIEKKRLPLPHMPLVDDTDRRRHEIRERAAFYAPTLRSDERMYNGHWDLELVFGSREKVQLPTEAFLELLDALDAAGVPMVLPQVKWSELFPDGRVIYCEEDDPRAFVEAVKTEFGFDPSADERWDWEGLSGPRFHCPAEHLDAIYGSGRWRVGS